MFAAPVWSDGVLVVGKVLVDGVELDAKRLILNFTDVEANPKTVIAAVPAKKIRVLVAHYTCSLTVELEWRSNTTVLLPPQFLSARTEHGGHFMPGYFVETTAGEALTLRQAQGQQAIIRGALVYCEV